MKNKSLVTQNIQLNNLIQTLDLLFGDDEPEQEMAQFQCRGCGKKMELQRNLLRYKPTIKTVLCSCGTVNPVA